MIDYEYVNIDDDCEYVGCEWVDD